MKSPRRSKKHTPKSNTDSANPSLRSMRACRHRSPTIDSSCTTAFSDRPYQQGSGREREQEKRKRGDRRHHGNQKHRRGKSVHHPCRCRVVSSNANPRYNAGRPESAKDWIPKRSPKRSITHKPDKICRTPKRAYFTIRMYYLSSVRVLHKARSGRRAPGHKPLNCNPLKDEVLTSAIINYALARILPLLRTPKI